MKDVAVPGVNAETGDDAVPLTEIGSGQPLSLKIRSIFPGSSRWHERERIGGTLVTSAVKTPILNGAALMVLHCYFKDSPAGEALIPPRQAEALAWSTTHPE